MVKWLARPLARRLLCEMIDALPKDWSRSELSNVSAILGSVAIVVAYHVAWLSILIMGFAALRILEAIAW